MSEKHGKICDNVGTEPKIFHARINLVSDESWKIFKSHHYNSNPPKNALCWCVQQPRVSISRQHIHFMYIYTGEK